MDRELQEEEYRLQSRMDEYKRRDRPNYERDREQRDEQVMSMLRDRSGSKLINQDSSQPYIGFHSLFLGVKQ